MDDWNDFGAVPPPNPRHLPPSQPDLFVPLPHSSTSSSVSDSSVANLQDDDIPSQHEHPAPSSSAMSQPSVTPTAPSTSASVATYPTRERSFIPSFPFLLKSRRDRPNSSDDTTLPTLPQRSHHPDRSIDPPNDQISAGSESDTHEPQSVRIPSTFIAAPITLNPPPNARVHCDAEDPRPPPLPPQGDLDDVPDDYELNSEGFRLPPASSTSSTHHTSITTSSLLRFPEKSYIKLEVISAKQVRSLLIFFNWFIVAAFLYSIMLIIAANTKRKQCQSLPILPGFLTEQQKATALPTGLITNCSGELQSLTSRRLSFSSSRLRRPLVTSHALAPFTPPHPQQKKSHPALAQRQAAAVDDDIDPDAIVDPNVFFLSVWISVLPAAYLNVSHYQLVIFSLFFFVLGVLYAIRIFSEGKCKTTHEQLWVLLLIIGTSLYYNVFETIIRLTEQNILKPGDRFGPWVYRIEEVLTVAREASFTVITFFYVWANLHSYRILDPQQRLTFRRFYLPKLLILLPLTCFLAVTFTVIPVQLTEIPLMAAPVFAFLFGEFKIIPGLRAELIAAVVKSLIDLVLFLIIVLEARRTFRVLENAPYMKHRTKRVGFRFFLYVNFVFYILFFCIQFMLLFGKPKGDHFLTLLGTDNEGGPRKFVPLVRADLFHYWTVGPNILLAGYVLVTAYVHLPRTSVGVLKGWFIRSELATSGSTWSKSEDESDGMTSVTRSADDDVTRSTIAKKNIWGGDPWVDGKDPPSSHDNDTDSEVHQDIVEPFVYRMRESKDHLQIKANCFTMQTHVIMFNFAWYVYYYGTSKLEKFRPKENPLPFNFRIQAHAKCEATDTQALVVDCTDRIIVTFKGTTSKRNVQTSLHMSHHRLPEIVCCNARGQDESSRLKRLFGVEYTHGKMHRGFATAYMSIADDIVRHVQILREQKIRPVFLTGHSLGGALATICSLDLWVKLNLSRQEIFVSTFGSPRVGNMDFKKVYDQVVPLHWRIVVDPDMITRMPFHGYKHVGKKVVLTAQGDMLIDPDALRRRPWTGEAAGFAYHRKAAYLLAMRAWCTRHHGMTYTPVFWPFPVRREDERRFAGAFDETESTQQLEMADRIASINAMVDQLGKTEDERVNMAVLEKWARLTRYKMLKEQLQTRRTGS
ncbi:unnamed protein product [Agarophyton chilense]|eukprot:gb/GEZJ01003274.1/.p1 GENE.gb/GEZJ01003274.1/~~gb/GEZJ01003274.1/.p1  ORF type:complete len:1144 (+),score=144.01 gb/GEZJ01003274.1/:1597-5028(+)